MMAILAERPLAYLTGAERRIGNATTTSPRGATLTGCMWKLREIRHPFNGGEFIVHIADDPPTWVLPTLSSLGSVLSLEPGWDSYGARQIDPVCVAAGLDLVFAIMRDDTPAPSVVPTSRGGIQFEWHTRGIDLEVELESPSKLHVFFSDTRTQREWEKELGSDLSALAQTIADLSRRT